MNSSIKLPCLRGRMGDWFYYVSLMKFNEIASRASMVPEIHKNQELSRWIQREIGERTDDIVSYLLEQEQRFFNSIIFGIYGGHPQWQELDIVEDSEQFSEEERNYFGKTFGVLSLSGDEKIFAIDGQHRTKAIQDAVVENEELRDEEVAVIFVAHRKTAEGEIRTRRLFSTLNRYAVPVTPSEIIALDEEDNCAILTRKLIEETELFKGKIMFSKGRSLSPSNTTSFTNIILLYDMIEIWLTDNPVFDIKVSGYNKKKYTTRRDTEENLFAQHKKLEELFTSIFIAIPALNKFFFQNAPIDRKNPKTSLLFKPIGQMILFNVLKVCKDKSKFKQALNYFSKDTFNLKKKVWQQVFIDPEVGNIKTDKSIQKFATQLILTHLGISLTLTKKDKIVYENFGIDAKRI